MRYKDIRRNDMQIGDFEQICEQKLFQWLLAWVSSNYAGICCSEDARIYALELHAARVFDDEGWCDYVAFNAVHRPEVLRAAQRRMFEEQGMNVSTNCFRISMSACSG